MSKNIDAIRAESEFSSTTIEQFITDFLKIMKYASVLEYVVVHNYQGNKEESINNFEVAKQLY